MGAGAFDPRDRAGAGGVPPERDALPELHWRGAAAAARRRSKCALSVSGREEISRGLARGESFRAIARQIGRPHTTVSREVGRNGGGRRYRAQRAEAAAWRRARCPKPSKLAVNAPLRAVVSEKLCRKWSPEQIAAWLRRTCSDDPGMRVSHETIYLSLFVQSRGALRRELCDHLRSGRRLRRPPAQRSKHQGQGQIPDKVMISERPAEASDRAVPGHWEGDLLLGQRPTGVATLVERQTRYLQLVALPEGHAAAAVRDALMHSIGQLPEQPPARSPGTRARRCSSTFGSRSTRASRSTSAIPAAPGSGARTRTPTVSCASTSPSAPTSTAPSGKLDAIAQELNDRPRQTLGWATPAQRLAAVLAQTPQS